MRFIDYLRQNYPNLRGRSDQEIIAATARLLGTRYYEAAKYLGFDINEPGFFSGIAAAGGNLLEGLSLLPGEIAASLAELRGASPEEKRALRAKFTIDALRELGRSIVERNPDAISYYGGLGQALSEAPFSTIANLAGLGAGTMLPIVAAPPAGAALGALGFARLGRGLQALGRSPVAQTGLFASASLPGIRQVQEETGKDSSLAAMGGALTSGLLERLAGPERLLLGQRALLPAKGLKENLRRVTREALVAGGQEAFEEAIQQQIQNLAGGAGLAPAGETAQAAAAGFLGGAALGGGVASVRRAIQALSREDRKHEVGDPAVKDALAHQSFSQPALPGKPALPALPAPEPRAQDLGTPGGVPPTGEAPTGVFRDIVARNMMGAGVDPNLALLELGQVQLDLFGGPGAIVDRPPSTYLRQLEAEQEALAEQARQMNIPGPDQMELPLPRPRVKPTDSVRKLVRLNADRPEVGLAVHRYVPEKLLDKPVEDMVLALGERLAPEGKRRFVLPADLRPLNDVLKENGLPTIQEAVRHWRQVRAGKRPFAAFVVAPTPDGRIALTTRAADRGEAGKKGLPGGKVGVNEAPHEAAAREAREEGWAVTGIEKTPFFKTMVEGRPVWWYRATSAKKLTRYKEKSRITPVEGTLEEVRTSGYGNDEAVAVFEARYPDVVKQDKRGEGPPKELLSVLSRMTYSDDPGERVAAFVQALEMVRSVAKRTKKGRPIAERTKELLRQYIEIQTENPGLSQADILNELRTPDGKPLTTSEKSAFRASLNNWRRQLETLKKNQDEDVAFAASKLADFLAKPHGVSRVATAAPAFAETPSDEEIRDLFVEGRGVGVIDDASNRQQVEMRDEQGRRARVVSEEVSAASRRAAADKKARLAELYESTFGRKWDNLDKESREYLEAWLVDREPEEVIASIKTLVEDGLATPDNPVLKNTIDYDITVSDEEEREARRAIEDELTRLFGEAWKSVGAVHNIRSGDTVAKVEFFDKQPIKFIINAGDLAAYARMRNLSYEEATQSIILHELGVHFGYARVLSRETLSRMARNIRETWSKDPELAALVERADAFERGDGPGKYPEKYADEEFLARLVEEVYQRGLMHQKNPPSLVQRLINWLKSVVRKAINLVTGRTPPLRAIKPEALLAFTQAAARRALLDNRLPIEFPLEAFGTGEELSSVLVSYTPTKTDYFKIKYEDDIAHIAKRMLGDVAAGPKDDRPPRQILFSTGPNSVVTINLDENRVSGYITYLDQDKLNELVRAVSTKNPIVREKKLRKLADDHYFQTSFPFVRVIQNGKSRMFVFKPAWINKMFVLRDSPSVYGDEPPAKRLFALERTVDPTPEAVARSELPKGLRRQARAASTTLRDLFKKGQYALSFLHDLVAEGKKYLPSLVDYQYYVEREAAYARHLQVEAENRVAVFLSLSEQERKKVSQFILDSVMKQKWGFQPKFLKGEVEIDPEFERRFENLSPKARVFVEEYFGFNHHLLVLQREAVLKGIDDEYEFLFDELNRRIAKAKTEEEREKIMDEHDQLVRERERRRQELESKMLGIAETTGPYTPLIRTGRYVTLGMSKEMREAMENGDRKTIDKLRGDPKHYFFVMHNTLGQAEAQAKELREQFDYTEAFEAERWFRETSLSPFPVFSRAYEEIQKADLDDDSKGKLQKELRRLFVDAYIKTLVESSARKSALKRYLVAGFRPEDVVPTFLSRANAQARFIAQGKFGLDAWRALQRVGREAKEPGKGVLDRAERMRIYNEILRRHAADIAYTNHPWADAAMSVSSFWLLLTSPAYYFQNATQPIMMSVPYMLKGLPRLSLKEAYDALFEGYRDLGEYVRNLRRWTLEPEKIRNVTGDDHRMLQILLEEGRLDIGVDTDMGTALDVAAVGKNKAVALMQRVTAALSRTARKVETINRVSTALAAYRLARRHGRSHDEALDYTRNVLDTTHGNYTHIAAPAIFKSNLGKVILQFRKFQLIQAALVAKLFHQTVRGETPAVRRAARRALLATLTHAVVLTGMRGLPAWAALTALANTLGSLFDGDEPQDAENELRAYLSKAFGKGFSQLVMDGVPGFLGMDLSQRIGWGNAFSLFPYTDVDLSSRSGFAQAVVTALGPTAALGMRFADGLGLIAAGNYYRGLETMLPRGLRDTLRAYRFATEGLTTRSGALLVPDEEINAFSVMAQALGLPTTEITNAQLRRQIMFEIQAFFRGKSRVLQNLYKKAWRQGDVEAMREIEDRWRALQDVRVKYGLRRRPLKELRQILRRERRQERDTVAGIQFESSSRGLALQLAELF